MTFIMGVLFTGQERGRIRWAAVQEWEWNTEGRLGPGGGGERKDPEDKLYWLLSLSL